MRLPTSPRGVVPTVAAVVLGILSLLLSGCTGDTDDPLAGVPEGHVDITWESGVWLGGALDAKTAQAFGRWRGRPVDVLTAYPAYATWEELATSEWHVATWDGLDAKLGYGLPLLPSDEAATLAEVAAGDHDDVWRSIARILVRHDRGHGYVRIGLEANGTWFPWGATAKTAEDFKAAFRHVAQVMGAVAPRLEFVFDISCGVPLTGAEEDRMAPLERLYPGDDVVDVVGCDHYDSWSLAATDESGWEKSQKPPGGPGLPEVADFARAHGKSFAVPEWGLTSRASHGSGDNPYFIERMFAFFYAQRDVLAFEAYFDEPGALESSIFQEPQNPKSAEVYRELW